MRVEPYWLDVCRQIVESWWLSNWDQTRLPSAFRNRSKPIGANRWVVVGVLLGTNVGRGIAGNNISSIQVGTVEMQFFEQRDVGTAAVLRLASEAARLFEQKQINGMLFGSAQTIETDDERSPFYQVNVSVPFEYDNLVPKGTIN